MIIYLFFIRRKNCPKLTTSLPLLSDNEHRIWEESKTIENKDKELVEIILSKYGFTEVQIVKNRNMLQIQNIPRRKNKRSSVF